MTATESLIRNLEGRRSQVVREARSLADLDAAVRLDEEIEAIQAQLAIESLAEERRIRRFVADVAPEMVYGSQRSQG